MTTQHPERARRRTRPGDTSGRLGRRALMVAAGLLIDRVLGEPPTAWHPVAWFGTLMTHLEQRGYRDGRAAGIRYAAAGVSLGLGAGFVLRSTATAVAVCVAGRELRRVALSIRAPLTDGDLPAARAALPALVGRDPSDLDASGISAAVVESVAENSVDAVIAPVFWALLGGAPGVLAHRAVNTMDAMVGHHGERYERFGWAAARLDDIANLVPARVFCGLVMLAAPRRAGEVARLVRRDAWRHPSPNSGVAETAVAAALGRELGGPLRYAARAESRPRLGDGPRPQPGDIARAVALVDTVEFLVLGGLVLTWLLDRHPGPIPWRSPCR